MAQTAVAEVIKPVDMNPKIEIISWQPIAFWKFKTTTTECPICKEHFESHCTSCVHENTTKGHIDCDITRGKCGHCFHKHCIDKWLANKKGSCPVCSTPYEMDINMNSIETWKKLFTKNKKD